MPCPIPMPAPVTSASFPASEVGSAMTASQIRARRRPVERLHSRVTIQYSLPVWPTRQHPEILDQEPHHRASRHRTGRRMELVQLDGLVDPIGMQVWPGHPPALVRMPVESQDWPSSSIKHVMDPTNDVRPPPSRSSRIGSYGVFDAEPDPNRWKTASTPQRDHVSLKLGAVAFTATSTTRDKPVVRHTTQNFTQRLDESGCGLSFCPTRQ